MITNSRKQVAIAALIALLAVAFVYQVHSNAALCGLAFFILVLAASAFWWELHKIRRRRKLWPKMNFSKVASEAGTSPINKQEFSADFDLGMVRPFLERIQSFIESGFGEAEIKRVCHVAATLQHDEERILKFPIRVQGIDQSFEIRIAMCDIDAPMISFTAPPALRKKIRAF